VEYNEDKSKILCYKSLRYSEILNSEICEYDIKSNEFSEAIFNWSEYRMSLKVMLNMCQIPTALVSFG